MITTQAFTSPAAHHQKNRQKNSLPVAYKPFAADMQAVVVADTPFAADMPFAAASSFVALFAADTSFGVAKT